MHAFFSAPLVEQRRKEFFDNSLLPFEDERFEKYVEIKNSENIGRFGRRDLYVFDDWNFDFFLHE